MCVSPFFTSSSLFNHSPQDAAPMREVKLFIHLMHLENNIEKIVTATAPYTVSADTKVCS